jgi:hypothetical protein
MVCSHRCIVVTINRTLYNVDVFKNITFKILNDTVDFNKHDINIFINDAGDNRATLQNYKATWTLLLTNEKAKSTFTRRLLRPSRPLTWALITILRISMGIKDGNKNICTFKLELDNLPNTVKPAHVVNSIKQSPVLKGHNFLDLS